VSEPLSVAGVAVGAVRPRQRQIIRAATASIEPDFTRGDVSEYAAMTSDEVEKAAGSGAQELRTWLVAAGAVGRCSGCVLAYEPLPERLTGMGVAVLDPATSTSEGTLA
jgi:2,3-dihydroxyphenylpropionate 1,2-dioxygenase